MLTIMSVGKIFNGDFGMIYAMVGSEFYTLSDNGRNRYISFQTAS